MRKENKFLKPVDSRNAPGIKDFNELPMCEYCTAAQAVKEIERLRTNPDRLEDMRPEIERIILER